MNFNLPLFVATGGAMIPNPSPLSTSRVRRASAPAAPAPTPHRVTETTQPIKPKRPFPMWGMN